MASSVRATLVAVDRLDEPTRATLEHLVNVSGVGTPPARLYLTRRLIWHLGLGSVPIPAGELKPDVVTFIDRRAVELVEQHRRRLPPVAERTMPGGE